MGRNGRIRWASPAIATSVASIIPHLRPQHCGPHGKPLASISRTSSSVGWARPPPDALALNMEARLSRWPSTVACGQRPERTLNWLAGDTVLIAPVSKKIPC